MASIRSGLISLLIGTPATVHIRASGTIVSP